ncbi:MAG: hypothetical protein ACUZ8O_09420 [Candidatus Anammoxibacter sp.]
MLFKLIYKLYSHHHKTNLLSCHLIHSFVSLVALLIAFSVFVSPIVNCSSIDNSGRDEKSSYFSTLEGYSTLRYRGQKLQNNRSDQDLFQNLSLSLGDSEKDRVTWHFFGTFREDIDDSSNRTRKEIFRRLIFPRTPLKRNPIVSNSPFFSVDDSIKDGFVARPYEFYADIKDVSLFKNIRAGRQYIREVENLHFDGLKMEFEDFKGIRFSTFAGVPVHFFETSGGGDFLLGSSVEFQPAKGSRVKLNYTYVNDDNNDIGSNDDNLFEFHLRQNIKEWWNIFADFSMIDQTARDVEIRSNWIFPAIDLYVNVSIFKQLSVLEDFTTEFDDFNTITGDYFPYTEYSINVNKGMWEHFNIGIGFNIRELNNESDEGQFNHEFGHYYATLSAHDFPIEGLSISVTGNVYDTDDDEIRSLGFDVRQKVGKKLTLGVGTFFSLFKRDVLALPQRDPIAPFTFGAVRRFSRFDSSFEFERDSVRTLFLNARYDFNKKWKINIDYEFERDNQESFHTIETALKYRF